MLDQFLSVLAGDIAETPVWTADITYWISGRRQDGTAKDEWETEEGYLQLHKDLGVLPYYYYDTFWVAQPVYDKPIVVSAGVENSHNYRRIDTPVGSLLEESVYLPTSACEGVSKHMVQTEAELDILIHVLEHRSLEPCNMDDYSQRRDRWSDFDGLPCLGLPRSPLPALAYEWCGLQGLVMLMLECQTKVEYAMRLLEIQEQPIIDAVCELCPPVVHFPDNLSSDNFTGYYDEHMRRRHADRLHRLHEVGIRAAVHLDGTVRGLLPKLVDVGFDAVEALTPQPAGDVSAEEMIGLAASGNKRDEVVLWGGVPGVMFAPPYTWDELRRHVEHVLHVWDGRRFVLGVADQVPPNGNIDYCKKISDLVGG